MTIMARWLRAWLANSGREEGFSVENREHVLLNCPECVCSAALGSVRHLANGTRPETNKSGSLVFQHHFVH